MSRRPLSALVALILLAGCASRVPADFESLTGVRVAALGDSITFGYQLSADEAWPARLQELLGDEYAVVNFGHNGANALEAGQWPYSGLKEYEQALTFEPAVVVSMLGANDSRAEYWDEADYRRDYAAMLDDFEGLPSPPAVWLALTPPAWDNDFLIRGEVIADEVLPANQQLADDRGWGVIDAHTPFDDAGLTLDGVHPTAEGAEVIAEAVAGAL